MKKYSQLKAMLSITKASLRSMLRSPSAIVFSLVFPIIFILVFGFIGGGSINLTVAVSKNTDQSNPIYQALANMKIISLIPEDNNGEVLQQLERGRIDGMINIDKDQTGKYFIELTTSEASLQNKTILVSVLNSVIMNMYKSNPNFNSLPVLVSPNIIDKVIPGREYKTIDFILPGQLGFSLLSTGVFGVAFVFFNLRQTLVLKRFFATPIKRSFIVLGEALGRLVFAMIGSCLIILLGKYLFGFTLVNGIITLLSMLFLCALGLIVFMGFGFVVSSIAKNESTIPPFANLITLPQFLLSGTFFSTSAFPYWLQPISNALPLTYLNQALRKVAFEGVSIFNLGYEIGILCIWGIIVYALAVYFFRWE